MVRPIIDAKILCGDSTWRRVLLLVDTGADRTVLSANVLGDLNLQYQTSTDQIGGVGGIAASVDITTQIQLERDDGRWITLRGTYAGCLDQNALDMSVLGRDVLNNFAVIVDRPADRILLLHGMDGYAIQRAH